MSHSSRPDRDRTYQLFAELPTLDPSSARHREIRDELVTGHLSLGPGRRGVHVRLVPMGVGYRYIGRGVWFDGLRADATLFLGKDRAISCAVEQL